MPSEPEPALDQSLAAAVAVAESALKRSAPIRGLIDLPPFDQMAGDRSMKSRREIVIEQLPVPIPLPSHSGEVYKAAPRNTPIWLRRTVLWSLFVLAVATVSQPAISLVLGVAWLASLVWTSKSIKTGTEVRPWSPPPGREIGGHATELELRVIWMARWQVAAVLQTRAWKSEQLAGTVGRIDLAAVLGDLTNRALHVLRFSATTLPMPTDAQPELRHQWGREQERIGRARADLVEQLAALMVYRNQLDRISGLLDQRDQMAVYSARAAAFDQILPPSAEPPDLLGAAGEQRDLQNNLTAQIQFLGQIADGSGNATALYDALYGQR